ncbi:PAS domain-containing protein [candidate division KSB1 bacterium]|nr:PAS domain-containing protein [candidate division KSB1 bacterium]
MNILLIGLRYHEVKELQDRFQEEFPHTKTDFAISLRDSWYRLNFASYDLIVLDSTTSEIDSEISVEEILEKTEDIPLILMIAPGANQKPIELNAKKPKYIIEKKENFFDRLMEMLKKGEVTFDGLDLSRQIQVKENLQKTWQYFTASIHLNKDPVAIVNTSFEIIEVNDAFLSAFRLTREEVIGSPCHRMIYNNVTVCNESEWTCPVRETLRLGLEYKCSTTKLHHPDYEDIKTTIRAMPIFGESNQVEEVIISFHKETSQIPKIAAQPFFDKNLLELMLSGLSDGLIFCTSENTLIIINQAAEFIFGVPKATLIGKSILELPLGSGSSWLADVLKSAKSKMRFNLLSLKTRINDQYVQIRFAPIYGNGQHYMGGFLYLTELSDPSKNEEESEVTLLEDKLFHLQQVITPNIIAEG